MKIRKESELNVGNLKDEWLETHAKDKPSSNCYFCEYELQHKKRGAMACSYCPGNKIDKKFHCENSAYDYYDEPLAFYAKLRELYKIYKANKK